MQSVANILPVYFLGRDFVIKFVCLLIHRMKNNRDVTIYDVARVLNISPSTVSRGLNNHPHINSETKKKIRAVAGEMGYQQNKFASSLRKRRTETIGVVVPKLNSYFMATVIAGMEKITNKHGYGLIISQSQESGKQEISCVSTLYNSRVDGILISLAFDTKNLDHFNILFNKDIPVVFFDRVADCHGCMSVVIDNFRAGYEVTAHLLEQGCRRIAHFGGNLLRDVYSERFRGYRQALSDRGIEFDPELVLISDLTRETGKALSKKIRQMSPRPDGIFASNDTTAVAAIVDLQKNGISVPDDIAVAGFNNEPISQVIRPNLTTIDYPAREIGEIAATALINKLNNTQQADLRTIILKHSLILRQSSMRKKQNSGR